MKRIINQMLKTVSIVSLVVLPGCNRYIDWGKDAIYQSPALCYDEMVPHAYIRSLRLYDGLTTVAFFDAMWLSHDVIDSYNEVHAERHGFGCRCNEEAFKHAMFDEPGVVSFYVLAATPHTNNVPLDDCNSPWLMHLRIGDHVISPECIRQVQIPPEIRSFFCLHYTRFKRQYCVRFKLIDCEGVPVDYRNYNSMQLCFAGARYQDCMCWQWDSSRHLIGYDEYHDDILAYDL